jgi:hypothetical protein
MALALADVPTSHRADGQGQQAQTMIFLIMQLLYLRNLGKQIMRLVSIWEPMQASTCCQMNLHSQLQSIATETSRSRAACHPAVCLLAAVLHIRHFHS